MPSFDASRFEPRRPVELVKAAFRECFAHGGAVFVAAAAIMLPATALNLAFMYLLGRTGALETMMSMQSMQGAQADPAQFDLKAFFSDMLLLGGGGVIVGAIGVLSGFAAAAAVGRMMAERALGRSYGAAQAWDFVLGRLWRLTGAGVVAGVALTGGYIVASIPAMAVSIALAAATGGMQPGAKPSPVVSIGATVVMLPILAAVAAYLASMPSVVAIEDLGGISAVFRSFRLVVGRLRETAAAIALGGLIVFGPPTALQMGMQFGLLERFTDALGGGVGTLAALAPGTVLGTVAWPIMLVLQALIYFSLRSQQTEEDFTPYDLTIEIGGELPEGVQDPFSAAEPAGSGSGSPDPTGIS